MATTYQHIYAFCRAIPRGRVATYGQIAALAGIPRGARLVGWALHTCPPHIIQSIPWQRIVNREGRISTTCREHTAHQQKLLLRKEGVAVTERGGNAFIDLKRYLWKPKLRAT